MARPLAGLAIHGVVVAQSLVVEARLLAQPVSHELASTTQAEGIEDRTAMVCLAARRLRGVVPFMESGSTPPQDLRPVVELVASGALAGINSY